MGVSHMLEHMVFKGTATRNARDLALALEILGGSLDAYTAREHTSYQARVLDEHLPQAADVLADLVFHPVLRESDLALERKVVLEEINTVDDTPDDLVFELHNTQLWGNHPYGYSILGTRETVGALDQSDLRALHSRAYHPEQVVVAAAGNVEHDALIETLESTGWADIPRGGLPPLKSPAPIVQAPSAVHFERDTAQTHIVIGGPSFEHSDPRRYAMSMIGMLFGGGMSSRLFQRIREELGLAYSVYSFQSFHEDAGTHGVYVGTTPETARAAVGLWLTVASLGACATQAGRLDGDTFEVKTGSSVDVGIGTPHRPVGDRLVEDLDRPVALLGGRPRPRAGAASASITWRGRWTRSASSSGSRA